MAQRLESSAHSQAGCLGSSSDAIPISLGKSLKLSELILSNSQGSRTEGEVLAS